MMMGLTPSVQKRVTWGQWLWRIFFLLNIGIIFYFLYTIGLRICIEQPQLQQLQQQQRQQQKQQRQQEQLQQQQRQQQQQLQQLQQQQQQQQQQEQQQQQQQQQLIQQLIQQQQEQQQQQQQQKLLQQQKQQIQSVQTMMQQLLSQKASNTVINDFDNRLRSILKCHDRSYEPVILQRGDYWVLKNYVRADHGEIKCHESITFTTHADYTFLDNLIPVLQRFQAPVSIAMHAPGTDLQPTLDAISYLRDCLPESNLVRMYTTFHIYFINQHTPKNIPNHSEALKTPYNCSLPAPYLNVNSGQLYKTQKQLQYPMNVARNIARDAALTHFILSSDIELYPSPGLVKKFLEMIARNDTYLNRKFPRVYPLPIFEAAANVSVPRNKTELQDYLRTGKAILFHKNICSNCHKVPKFDEWVAAKETDELGVFHIGKRLDNFRSWEPMYIGTHAEPHYDYRLSWDGRGDKMPQGYAMCALDYEFHILNNAFFVHRPGIKMPGLDAYRGKMTEKATALINNVIYAELQSLYGKREGCTIF